MRTLKTTLTAEELERLSSSKQRMELVRGRVYEMAPAGGRHGGVGLNVGTSPNVYVRMNGLGGVFAAETGFIIRRNPDTVLAPDVAYISDARMAPEEVPESFIEMAPDLVVEVVPPDDSRREMREKKPKRGWRLAYDWSGCSSLQSGRQQCTFQ